MKLRIKSGTVNYVDEGNGAAVLFLHAFPLNLTMWDAQLAAFKGRFRVIAPDLRGFGKSTPSARWTIEQVCEDLAEFTDQLQITDFVLVGLSMGGYIGLPFTAMFPKHVRRLVLADTRARADNAVEKKGRDEMIAAIQTNGMTALVGGVLPRLLKPQPDASILAHLTSMIRQTNPDAAVHALMAMRDRADATALLARLTCPVLVITGEHDVLTRVTDGRAIAEAVTNGNFVMIPDAGHLSNLENPAAFNRALESFL